MLETAQAKQVALQRQLVQFQVRPWGVQCPLLSSGSPPHPHLGASENKGQRLPGPLKETPSGENSHAHFPGMEGPRPGTQHPCLAGRSPPGARPLHPQPSPWPGPGFCRGACRWEPEQGQLGIGAPLPKLHSPAYEMR